MKVMALTTNFGFGPVSKLNTIINELKKEMPDTFIDFYGNGISKEYLGQNHNIENFYDLDSDKDFDEVARNINNYDVVINVMNIDILKYCNNKSAKMYFIDSLSMLWNKSFDGSKNIDMYFIQDFFGNIKNIENMNVNYQIVGPIVDIPIIKNREKKNILLINFSGLYNPHAKEAFFLTLYLQ